eukprot:Hpha_TRINITY_DN15851_c4_g2::TRINITY_DN15851_c4_g2_i1::g.191494::m.191494
MIRSCIGITLKLTKPQWEWQDDSTYWLLFDPEDSAVIEGLYRSCGCTTSAYTKDLTWNKRFQTQYKYDFSMMRQQNMDSKRVRDLRRTEVQCCSLGHTMTERDGTVVTCSYCSKQCAGISFHCSVCEEARCAQCAGAEIALQNFSTPEEFIRCFKLLSQRQTGTLESDTATSAMLKRDNLGVVWTSHSDVGRTFGEATGKNMTDVTLFAVPPASPDGKEREVVPFPAVRAPNYADPVDILPTTKALKFQVRDLTGKLRTVNLMQFLEEIGEFIGGLGRSANWKDPIDDTPMQQSTQFSVIPVPSGSTEVGVGATGSRCTNLHVVIGPGGEIGWAREKRGMQKIYFRDSKGEELRTIRLVPEQRKEVAKAFFKVQVRDETVQEEGERYKNAQNALLHLQIAMDGVPQVDCVANSRPSSYAPVSSPADQVQAPVPPDPVAAPSAAVPVHSPADQEQAPVPPDPVAAPSAAFSADAGRSDPPPPAAVPPPTAASPAAPPTADCPAPSAGCHSNLQPSDAAFGHQPTEPPTPPASSPTPPGPEQAKSSKGEREADLLEELFGVRTVEELSIKDRIRLCEIQGMGGLEQAALARRHLARRGRKMIEPWRGTKKR